MMSHSRGSKSYSIKPEKYALFVTAVPYTLYLRQILFRPAFQKHVEIGIHDFGFKNRAK